MSELIFGFDMSPTDKDLAAMIARLDAYITDTIMLPHWLFPKRATNVTDSEVVTGALWSIWEVSNH